MGLRIVNVKPNSPEWALWRSNGIGASNAAAVLGKCKFKTAYELFLELTNRKPGFEGNAATERGKELEPAARASYEIDQGFVEAPELCLMHPKYDFITASLDGYRAEDRIVLEIKCPSEASHKMALEGEVPEYYWIQMQHQLMVSEAELGHYWSFRDGSGVLVEVNPELEFQADLLKAELAFWELVQSDIAPPLTDRDTKLIIDNTEMISIAEKLKALKADKSKKAKELSDSLKAQFIEIGGHNKVRCGDVLVSKSLTKAGKDSFRLTVKESA